MASLLTIADRLDATRTLSEAQRITRVGDGLLDVLHGEWAEEEEANGPMCPGDFGAALLTAAAALIGQHIDPQTDIETAIADVVTDFAKAFASEVYAEVRRQAAS